MMKKVKVWTFSFFVYSKNGQVKAYGQKNKLIESSVNNVNDKIATQL